MDELMRRLAEADRRELRPCEGCFMECEPSHGQRHYPCPEPMRRWATEHEWSAALYEEEESQ